MSYFGVFGLDSGNQVWKQEAKTAAAKLKMRKEVALVAVCSEI